MGKVTETVFSYNVITIMRVVDLIVWRFRSRNK